MNAHKVGKSSDGGRGKIRVDGPGRFSMLVDDIPPKAAVGCRASIPAPPIAATRRTARREIATSRSRIIKVPPNESSGGVNTCSQARDDFEEHPNACRWRPD
jgi:hypothetical protein